MRNRFPATASSSRSAAAASAKPGSARRPGGLFKAIKFVFGNLNSLDVDGARAEQELKALNRVKEVRHPFVLSMDRIEVVGGELVIVMELADRSLHDAFEECLAAGLVGIPRDTLLRYIRDAAEGLDHMNEKHDLQHLDIKPRNLFLVSDRVKVGDFGLVKHLERSGASGILGGVTPLYAAAGNLHRRHQQPQRPVQPGHRLPGTAHRPAAVQRQERPPAGPAAHERARRTCGACPKPSGPSSPAPWPRTRQALPQLPGLRPRPVHRPLGRRRRRRPRRGKAGGNRPKTMADTMEDILLEQMSSEDAAIGDWHGAAARARLEPRPRRRRRTKRRAWA